MAGNVELDTFEELSARIQDHITFSVDSFLTKAIPKRLITRDQQRTIRSEGPEHKQAGYLMDILSQRVKIDPTNFHTIIHILKEEPSNEKFVKEIEEQYKLNLAIKEREEEKKEEVDLPSPPQHNPESKKSATQNSKEKTKLEA